MKAHTVRAAASAARTPSTLRPRLVQVVAPVLALILAASVLTLAPATAQTPDDIAKAADTALRTAERNMFSGKAQEAFDQLGSINDLLSQLEATDPNHPKLSALQAKYAKLDRDLSRRLPQTAGTPPGAPTGTPTGTPTGLPNGAPTGVPTGTAPGAPPAAGLPAGAAKRIGDIDRELQRVDGYLDDSSTLSVDARVDGANARFQKIDGLMAEIEKGYGAQIPAGNPEIMAVKKRVADAKAGIAALASQSAAASGAEAVPAIDGDPAADGARVEALYAKFHDPLDLIHGNSLVYGASLEDAQQALDTLVAAEQEIMPELQPALAELAPRYGTQPMEINNKLHKAGVQISDQFGNDLGWLIEAAEKIPQSRTASAATIAHGAQNSLSGIESLAGDIQLRQLEKAKARLQIGQQLDPNNQAVNSMLATIDTRIADTAEKLESDIDNAVWKGNVGDFPGPGNASDLARAALDYFRSSDQWGRNPARDTAVLAVAVRGPWQVAERNIFGQIVRWRLPVHLAITDETLKPDGIARVYELSVLAQQGGSDNAPQQPPFDGYWVGNNWMMRINNL